MSTADAGTPRPEHRLWRFLKLSAIGLATLAALVAALAVRRVRSVLRSPDPWAARERWERPLGFDEADAAALDLVAEMSLAEKLGEMAGAGVAPMVASLLVRGTMAPVRAGGIDRLGIPPLTFTDGPRGVTVGHSTSFPVAMARAATWNPDLERRVGDAIGREARAHGANYWAGLCVNLVRHPSMGRAEESYGEDPWLMGEMAVAALEGVQRHHVMACAKHFALNSMETARYKVSVEIDDRTLHEVYLPHFRKVVERDVASFMSAYNRVRGEWCGESRHLLSSILRERWGFRGFVTSDWDFGVYDAARGVHAGLDVEMPTAKVYADLESLVARGKVPIEEIDGSVRRIVRTKLHFLTREDPEEYSPSLVACPDHVALAREVAEEGMVLLKNDGALLPLDRDATRTMAVVGFLSDLDNTGDRGSSRVRPPHTASPLQGVRDLLGPDAEVLHADGSDLDEVRAVAEAADAVLVVAGTHHDEVGEYISLGGENQRPTSPEEKAPLRIDVPFREPIVFSGGDRVPLALKDRDLRVIETACGANERCIVALVGGSVFTMEDWRDDVPSILMAWYFGMEGGHALARILFGDVVPSGRMPLTTPRDESQLPFFDEFADTIEYGPLHGYTLLDAEGHAPAFPFGHGLSYTTFAFDDLVVATPEVPPDGRLEVTVDVTNTGGRTGAEVVQLYVGFEGSAVERPIKLLRAFDKVPLEPGETRTVALGVDVRELAWFDPAADVWRVEPMRYSVLVGPSSRPEDLLEGTFTVVPPEEVEG